MTLETDIRSISTKSELKNYLKKLDPNINKKEIKQAILLFKQVQKAKDSNFEILEGWIENYEKQIKERTETIEILKKEEYNLRKSETSNWHEYQHEVKVFSLLTRDDKEYGSQEEKVNIAENKYRNTHWQGISIGNTIFSEQMSNCSDAFSVMKLTQNCNFLKRAQSIFENLT